MGENGFERDKTEKPQPVEKPDKSLYYKKKIFAVAPMIDWTESSDFGVKSNAGDRS